MGFLKYFHFFRILLNFVIKTLVTTNNFISFCMFTQVLLLCPHFNAIRGQILDSQASFTNSLKQILTA